MKSLIIYFSGTGNTKVLCERIATLMDKSGEMETELVSVESFDSAVLKKGTSIDILGIAYPIYDYQPPRIIMDFLKKLESGMEDVPVFLISTYSANHLDTNSHAIKILESKGYPVISKGDFKTPAASVYLFGNPDNILMKKLSVYSEKIDEELSHYSSTVLSSLNQFNGKAFSLPAQFVPFNGLLQKMSNLTFGRTFYRNLKVNGNCNGCGACESRCPDQNIRVLGGRAEVLRNNDCLRCLRCHQICPSSAISFTSSRRRGFYGKEKPLELLSDCGIKV